MNDGELLLLAHPEAELRDGRMAAVVLAFLPGNALHETLQALVHSTMPPGEVVVVDNAGGDAVTRDIVAGTAGVRLLLAPQNDGYAAGINLGIASLRSDPEAVLLLTHECVLAPDALELLFRSLQGDATVGIVGPVLGRRSRRAAVWSAGGCFSRLLHRPVHRRFGEALVEPGRSQTVHSVAWLDGAALLVRPTALRQAGGLNEAYFLYWEDVDICVRVREAGWGVSVCPGAVAWQEPSTMPPYLDARGNLLFHLAHGSRATTALAWLIQLLTAGRDVLAPHRPLRERLGLARARLLGMRHARTGDLDRMIALKR